MNTKVMMMMMTKRSHTDPALQLLDFHMNTQQISLLIVWHDDYLLSISWKWIILKVFILTIFTLSRLRKRRKKRVAEVEDMEEEPGETGTLCVTLWKYIKISV